MDEDALSRILKAAGDTTRRQILTLLVQEGALRVTALAALVGLQRLDEHHRQLAREFIRMLVRMNNQK